MRIIPFPADDPLPGQEAWVAAFEAALSGESQGPEPTAWRQLRDDVRSLAPTMTPAFEGRLAQGLERLGALEGDALDAGARAQPADSTAAAKDISAHTVKAPRYGAPARLRRALRLLGAHRPAAAGSGAAVLLALVVALLIIVPQGSGPAVVSPPAENGPVSTTGASGRGEAVAPKSSAGSASSSAAQASPLFGDSSAPPVSSAPSAPSGPAASLAPGRVQQLAASITLGSTAADLQKVSDHVAQLAVRDGGYVQSSNVQVQRQGTSEATLALRLPSARLGAALAAIGRLAPIRAENQSLQDITDVYDAAHRRLSDAEAERRALLRALAAATTAGQIHALRERLSASRAAVAQARSAVNAVSQRASTAEVEVSILGDARAASEGLTLHRGLHDAGRVLVVALTAILVAASVLLPLALVLAALAGARSAWRRYRRERVLDAR